MALETVKGINDTPMPGVRASPAPGGASFQARTQAERALGANRRHQGSRTKGTDAPPAAHPASFPGNGPSCMKAFRTLAVTREALLSQSFQGRAWPQAMELADQTAPPSVVVK